MAERVASYPLEGRTLGQLATLAASIGTASADAAALMFRLPMPSQLMPIFEDTIRQEVTAEMLKVEGLRAIHLRQLEDVAWTAFRRRLAKRTPLFCAVYRAGSLAYA